jgi:hypothetical protein
LNCFGGITKFDCIYNELCCFKVNMVLQKVIQSNTCKPLLYKEKPRPSTQPRLPKTATTVALGVNENRENGSFQRISATNCRVPCLSTVSFLSHLPCIFLRFLHCTCLHFSACFPSCLPALFACLARLCFCIFSVQNRLQFSEKSDKKKPKTRSKRRWENRSM